MPSKSKKMLDYQLYLQRENEFIHQPYTNELTFYTAVKQGNLKYIEDIKKKYSNSKSEGKGTLSKNAVRNELYHFIVNIAIITRNCIEGGLSQEVAYTLSDLYIQRADELRSIKAIQELNDEMVWEFTTQMNRLRTQKVVSPHISKCIHYIYDNLHLRLTIQQISKHIRLNPSYLSTLFKKETGYSVHEFIQNTRLETAENMLVNTSYSYTDIANTLCFSSQSHFIQLFHKKYGMTPAEYRKNHAKY